MSGGPSQFVIFPDPLIAGKDSIVSATSQGGIHPGRGTPATTNEGSGAVFEIGSYLNKSGVLTPTNFSYRVMASGGVYGAGTWGWLEPGVDTIDSRGQGHFGFNDLRYSHSAYPSLIMGSGYQPWGLTGLGHPGLHKEFHYYTPDALTHGYIIRVAHRHYEDKYTTWNHDSCTFDGQSTAGLAVGFAPNLGSLTHAIGACVLPDGSMRLCFQMGRDIDIYESQDGLAWTTVADQILGRYTDAQTTFTTDMRLTCSGDWMRLTFIGGGSVSNELRTLVSSDRGSSWTEVSSGEITPYNKGGTYFEVEHGIAGFEDGAGTFLLGIQTSGVAINFYRAERSGGWEEIGDYNVGATSSVRRHCIGFAPDGLMYVFVDSTVTLSGSGTHYWPGPVFTYSDSGFKIIQIPLASLSDQDTWRRMDQDNNNNTQNAFEPCRMTAYRAGPYLALCGIPGEWATAQGGSSYFTGAEWNFYERRGGWDTMAIQERINPNYSLSTLGDISYQPTTPITRVNWMCWAGRPAGSGYASTDSYWTTTSTGSVSSDWNNARLRIRTMAAAGASDSKYYTLDGSLTATTYGENASWCIAQSTADDGPPGCCVEFCARVGQGGDPTTEDISFEINSTESSVGGVGDYQSSIMVRMSTTQWNVYVQDKVYGSGVVSSTLVKSFTGLDSTKFYTMRLAFLPDPNLGSVVTACRLFCLLKEETSQGPWEISAAITNVVPVTWGLSGAAPQNIQFGHFGHTTGVQNGSRWRWVKVMGFHDCVQSLRTAGTRSHGWHYPDDLRGMLMTADPPTYMRNGVEAYWGGAGAMESDVFKSKPQYTFAAENMLMDSPRLRWQSTDLAAQTITMVAGSTLAESAMNHSGFAMFGTNFRQAVVTWADDAALTTNAVTQLWSAALYSGSAFKIESLHAIGSSITLADPSQQIIDGQFNVAQTKGKRERDYYLRVTATGSTTVSAGDTFRIKSMSPSIVATTHVLNLEVPSSAGTTDLTGLAASSCIIYADRGVIQPTAQQRSYMGITIANTETTPQGNFQIGTLCAGIRHDLDVPLEWSFTNNEQPNFTRYRSRSAVQWGFVEGPPQRSVSAMLVGDCTQQERMKLRYLQRMGQYEKAPVTLVMNSQHTAAPESIMSAYLTSGSDLDNAGWYLDVNGTWKTAGDVTLTFEENV